MIEVLVLTVFSLMVVGSLVFFGWLVEKHPPKDVEVELEKMLLAKEAELKSYKESLRKK